ncbi:MAG: hypothetical protein ACX932_07410, partial [Gammaproteobacteria bacterium]
MLPIKGYFYYSVDCYKYIVFFGNRSAPSKKPSSLGDLGSSSWEKVLMDSMSTALFSQEELSTSPQSCR